MNFITIQVGSSLKDLGVAPSWRVLAFDLCLEEGHMDQSEVVADQSQGRG